MKLKLLSLKVFSLVLLTGLLLNSCKKDSDPVDDIVGTWSWQGATFDIMIGNKTLTQYLIDEGYTPTEAAQFEDILTTGYEADFAGSLNVKSDHTYTSTLGGESDSGTWTLSSDRRELTIVSNADGSFTFDVAELTAGSLKLQTSDTYTDDFNGDEVPETMSIDIEMSFTK